MALCFLSNACLECAFDRVSAEIVCAIETTTCQKQARRPQPDTRQALEVRAIHIILKSLPVISFGCCSPSTPRMVGAMS